jgi:Kef-type K+ transport system membrane component KefB
MVENQWLIAAVWMGLAFLASIISIRLAISVALVEIIVGMLGGNFLHHYMLGPGQLPEWITFLAGFGSVLLTFLAGAEIEPDTMKRYWREALSIGFVGFLFPFLGAMAFAYYGAHWSPNASKIAGIAMSTTSVAVVYAVMVETGLNRAPIGKLILAACFVCDLGTVLALGVLFASYNIWMLLLLIVATGVLLATPRVARWVFGRFGNSVSEPDVKFLFLLLFFLGGLAAQANSEAVLTAYLLGLVVASVLAEHKETVRHMRSTVFTMLTPFYFLKAGMYVSLHALWLSLGVITLLFLVKMVTKIVGIYPLTYLFKIFDRRLANYTTAMMSTGLTFGTISALYGLNHHYIDQQQYTVLVTVVIGSAIIPTMIAQRFFKPDVNIPTEIDKLPTPLPGTNRGVTSIPASRPIESD